MTGFAVVEFMETSAVELVPGSWLKDKKTCLWPSEWKFAKIATVIGQKAAPDDSFNAIRVKLLYETDSYLKAREKLQKAEETSASDLQMEPEVIDHNVNPQKRKIRQNQKYIDSSDDDDNDGKFQSKQKCSSVSKRSCIASESDSSPDKMTQRKGKRVPPLPPLPVLSPPPPTPSTPSTSSNAVASKSLFGSGTGGYNPKPTVSAVERKMFESLEEIKEVVKLHTKQLNTILKKLDSSKETSLSQLPENVYLPLSTYHDVLKLEDDLKDETCKQQMINYLGIIGGENLKDTEKNNEMHYQN